MNKNLYILSTGHSGSTLLDIFLGQFDNTLSTGELKHLTWQYYREIKNIDTKQKCTCGATFTNCELWSEVISKMGQSKNIDKKDVPEKLKIKYFDSLSFFKNTKSHAVLRRLYKFNRWNMNLPKIILSLFLKRVNQNNLLIANSIREIRPEIQFIIDSSKDIIKYSEMRKKHDAFPIILIRNVDDIMKSQYVKGSAKNQKAWQRYYNAHILPLVKTMNKNDYHIMSYEKFISQPLVEIKKLADKVGMNITDFKEEVETKDYHLVAGNPMRYEPIINIRRKKVDEDILKERLEANKLDSFFTEQI